MKLQTYNILQLPRELLIVIFGLLDAPKDFSRTCRLIRVISRDPAVVWAWLLSDLDARIPWCPRLVFELPFLARFDDPRYHQNLEDLLDRALECADFTSARWILKKSQSVFEDYEVPWEQCAYAAMSEGDVDFLDYVIPKDYEDFDELLLDAGKCRFPPSRQLVERHTRSMI